MLISDSLILITNGAITADVCFCYRVQLSMSAWVQPLSCGHVWTATSLNITAPERVSQIGGQNKVSKLCIRSQ